MITPATPQTLINYLLAADKRYLVIDVVQLNTALSAHPEAFASFNAGLQAALRIYAEHRAAHMPPIEVKSPDGTVTTVMQGEALTSEEVDDAIAQLRRHQYAVTR